MKESIRSFIAVETPQELVAKIEPLLRDLAGLGDLRVVRKENLHFTLKFLGEISPEMIQPIGDCMRSVQGMLGFEMSICGFGAFPNARRPRVVWIGSSSEGDRMVALARLLDERLHELGFAKERSYVPHLTLARSRTGRANPGLTQYLERMRQIDIGSMLVNSLVLKKSVLTPQGPIYSDLLRVGPSEG